MHPQSILFLEPFSFSLAHYAIGNNNKLLLDPSGIQVRELLHNPVVFAPPPRLAELVKRLFHLARAFEFHQKGPFPVCRWFRGSDLRNPLKYH